jgi:hypothetical protein
MPARVVVIHSASAPRSVLLLQPVEIPSQLHQHHQQHRNVCYRDRFGKALRFSLTVIAVLLMHTLSRSGTALFLINGCWFSLTEPVPIIEMDLQLSTVGRLAAYGIIRASSM